jgi:hypothetical protein
LPTTERRYDNAGYGMRELGNQMRNEDRPPQHASRSRFEQTHDIRRPPPGSPGRIRFSEDYPSRSGPQSWNEPATIEMRSQSPSRPPMADLRAKLSNRKASESFEPRFGNEGRTYGSDYEPGVSSYAAEKRPSEMGNPYGPAKIQRYDDFHRYSKNY